MSNRTTIVRKHDHIPNPYYKPAMFAIKCFRSYKSLSDSVEIAFHTFTSDPSMSDYIPPGRLNKRKLRNHIIRWIASD